MTIEHDVVIAAAPAAGGAAEHHSYIDWAAVIGGIVLASAISLLLLAFGSAVGLSFANFRSFTGVAPIWVGIAAASWLLWVQISSFMAGGYLTGRMRRRFHDATEHESDVRDGAHGLLVWAGALVVGAIITVGGLGAAVGAIGNAVGTATTAASNVAQGAAANPGAPTSPTSSSACPPTARRRRAPTLPTPAAKPDASLRPAPSRATSATTTRPISASSWRSRPACRPTRPRPASTRC